MSEPKAKYACKVVLTLQAQEHGLTTDDLVLRGHPIETVWIQQADGSEKPAKEQS